MAAYYNEIDPAAAQWLRNLIEAGHIAPGHVDERSIEDVTPEDLAGYTQCHFFAGIGVWSYALRRAGWSDDRPVWTGSCPCQPFSSAGAQAGFDDERHLWPHFHYLIEQCRPSVVFGEQVASKAVEPWIDLVQTDLEGLGYAFAGIPFPSAGVGAPHIRDRLFWVADAKGFGREDGPQVPRSSRQISSEAEQIFGIRDRCSACRMADANGGEQQGQPVIRGFECHRENAGRPQGVGKPEPHGDICGLAYPESGGWGQKQQNSRGGDAGTCTRQAVVYSGGGDTGGLADSPSHRRPRGGQSTKTEEGRQTRPDGGRKLSERPEGCAVPSGQHAARVANAGTSATGPANGFWEDADWLFCRDGKWRPVDPSTFPLVDGAASRVVRLRAYGNAINAEAAKEFIEAYLDTQTGG